MKMNCDIYSCVLYIILIASILYVSISKNNKLEEIGRKLTQGKINTLLILVIITLILTENVNLGILLSILYLLTLVRFNTKKENFQSEYGPSPLNCDTYRNKKDKIGNTQYPLHA
jgi:hypothetical protein